MANGPDVILAAWAIQRATGSASAIPDLLAVWRKHDAQPGLVLAFEVDLGTEPVQSVFVPKLVRLAETLRPEHQEKSAIVVLTMGRRAFSVRKAIDGYAAGATELLVLDLPPEPGRAALPHLRSSLGIDG
jgi:hypothetical protein